MRLDRSITLGCVAPLLGANTRARRLPILMYHSISDHAPDGLKGYYQLNTPGALFREHLQILKEEGFRVVSLAEGLAALRHPEANGSSWRPSAVITFDDGFRDFETTAWPLLQEFGFSATMFLPTAYIGDQRKIFLDRECMTWEEIRRLQKQGAIFGSHTVSHPLLVELPPEQLRQELQESKKVLEAQLGVPITEFAHPYGFPLGDQRHETIFRTTLQELGYQVAVTTILGSVRSGDNPLLLPRLPANGADDSRLFRAKLRGAYDWISRPQRLVKWAGRVLRRPSTPTTEAMPKAG